MPLHLPRLTFPAVALLAAHLLVLQSPSYSQTVPGPGSTPPPLPGASGQPAAPSAPGSLTLQFPPGTPLSEVLELYQQLVKKRLLRDPAVEAKTVGIETSGQLTTAEAIEFIEKTLLLNDIAIVPSGDNMLKVLSTEGAKKPAGEGVPVIVRESDLPDTDQVVSFVLPLQHLGAEDAAQTFAQIIPPHAYGIVAAIPNARALHITENTSTIRAYISLARQVDVPPNETKHQTIHLQRADAEEVGEQLVNLLGLDKQTTSGSGGSGSGGGSGRNPPRVNAPLNRPDIQGMNPQMAAAQQAAQINVLPTVGSAPAEAVPPVIQTIPRTNSLLIVARPLDIKYIESLVLALDAESPTGGGITRKLNYMDLTTFLEVAEKALLRYDKEAQGGLSSGGGANRNSNSGSTTGFGNNSNMNSRFGGGGLGDTSTMGGDGLGGTSSGLGGGGLSSGGFGGMSGGLGGGSSGSSTPMNVTTKAFSVLVANTLVVVDPASSSFYASGPPEQLRILTDLADSLDVRPKQIMLTTIIGEFSLGKDFRFGLDWIRTIDNVGKNNLLGGILQTQGTAYANPSALGGIEDFLPALDGLTVYGQIGKHLSVFMQTLEASNRFKVLQQPTIITLNHEAATISIGQSIPYAGQTISSINVDDNASLRSTVQFIDAALTIQITPHIYNDNEVHLEFNQQNTNITGFTTIDGNPAPNRSVQSMQNRVIVPDRTTVMLGGLIDERKSDEKNGLPFLVRVPILKHLFGHTSKDLDRRELLIFIQPRILTDGEQQIAEQSDISGDMLNYPDVQKFSNPNDSNPLLPLPDWKENGTPRKAVLVK